MALSTPITKSRSGPSKQATSAHPSHNSPAVVYSKDCSRERKHPPSPRLRRTHPRLPLSPPSPKRFARQTRRMSKPSAYAGWAESQAASSSSAKPGSIPRHPKRKSPRHPFQPARAAIEAALEARTSLERGSAVRDSTSPPPAQPRAPGIPRPLLGPCTRSSPSSALGYSTHHGPQVESDFYDFGALNFPQPPARDTQAPSSSRDRLLAAAATASSCAPTPARFGSAP